MGARQCRTVAIAVGLMLLSSITGSFASDLLVSSRFASKVLRYDSQTGRFLGVFATGHGMANPNGIAIGPDGNLYTGNGDEGRIQRWDGQTGDYLGDFVTPSSSGGNVGNRAIAFGPDGNLYVDSGGSSMVLEYNGRTGAFMRVAAQGNGMNGVVGLAFGPDGNLYIGSALNNTIFVFDMAGNFLRSFNCGSGHSNVVGLLFTPDGRLLAAQSVTNEVLAFDPTDGSCQGVFASGGGLSTPIYMILGQDGNVIVGSFGNDSVIEYDVVSGAFIKTLVASGSGTLDGTHSFAFVPDPVCSQLVRPATSWWPADSSANDVLLTNHGSLMNGAGFAPGKDQMGFLLDGVDDYVSVPEQSSLDPSLSFSIEAWVKTASPSSPDGTILAKNECGHACTACVTNSYYGLSIAGGKAAFRVRDNSTGCRSAQLLAGQTVIGDAQWHHVMAVRDTTAGTLSLYVDGTLDARALTNTDADGAIADDEGDPDPLTIGADFADGTTNLTLPFAGQIDEVIFYRRAVSECEIGSMIHLGHGIKCKGDLDADGVVDYKDNCPGIPNATQVNADNDTNGDACDCSKSIPGSFAWPGEVEGFTVGRIASKNRLEWCSVSAQYGSQTTYNVVRGSVSTLPVGSGGETCYVNGITSTVTTDTALPVAGQALWYLVRARNTCSVGSYGFRSDGNERSTSTCP